MNSLENFKNFNSWQKKYERLHDSSYNKQARKDYERIIFNNYSGKILSETEEAILFSNSFQKFLLKNPAAAEFGSLDEYEVKQNEGI